MQIDTKQLNDIFKILKRNNVRYFKHGDIEIHLDPHVNMKRIGSVTVKKDDIEESLQELQELDDENLLINDPEAYERRMASV